MERNFMKLHDNYSTDAILKLIVRRYGLNRYGIRQILRIDIKRLRELKKGKIKFSHKEYLLLTLSFQELVGKVDYERNHDDHC